MKKKKHKVKCYCAVPLQKSDLKINVPGFNQNALPVRTLPVRIETIEIKHDVALLRLALPKAPSFAFYAGQYIDLLLPAISAAAIQLPILLTKKVFWTLHIRKRENGVCSEMILVPSLKIKEKALSALKAIKVHSLCNRTAINRLFCWQRVQVTHLSAASCLI